MTRLGRYGLDWHSRRVLFWRISNTMDGDFCISALEEATVKFGKPEIFNTDQGSQFTSEAFRRLLLENGIKISRAGTLPFFALLCGKAPNHTCPVFGARITLQSRLPNELKLHGITELEAVSSFLREQYMAEHNARFVHGPEYEESAFCPLQGVGIDNILCVQEERRVNNDNTISRYFTVLASSRRVS